MGEASNEEEEGQEEREADDDDGLDDDELDGHGSHYDLTAKLRQSHRTDSVESRGGEGESGASAASGSGSTSFNSDSILEILDDEEEEENNDLGLDEEEGMLEDELAEGDPLVGTSGRRRRRRKRWDEGDEKSDKSLFELVAPLVLAHPLPLLPFLSAIPSDFLPAGVVFFIPIYCVLIALSSCAHIVIVYLAWYLKVGSFEEVFGRVTGRFGRYGRWAGRGIVMLSTTGLVVPWLGSLHSLLSPVVDTFLPNHPALRHSILWTIIPSACLLPSLFPSRMTRSIRRSSPYLALLLPLVVFLVIGRTSELNKAAQEDLRSRDIFHRAFGIEGKSSAGAGITTLAIFLSPHINTIPIHRTLTRNKRSSFPLPCLISSGIVLALTLPFALVPYYLLPYDDNSIDRSVFSRLPLDDGWVNLARLFQCFLSLGTCNVWILRCRDTVLSTMGVESGERVKAGRWVGLGLWVIITALACVRGWVGQKIEMIGIILTLGVAWFLPSLFFIITFHVRSPLAIIFTHKPSAVSANDPTPTLDLPRAHSRSDSLNDPSTDVLLARKERQLQKRRLGRRLWQDLIVYVGILPVGSITLAWSIGSFIGLW
ncbi:hypothetical protein BD324DRAFT_582450 [Kockovaella imperatae]|uniref:Transmembrane amino acid transporter protein-domain-containing protein n=1 Tax=Kockovaella imperatae TaxID=4999 RepID=A0A1Y1UAE1_9TREE|nr:hypothetical protein BD324DRAFT_582450 [Kockovaella imperatae]ORX34982.1 hypothetical protein BD324DRAFT_582450 [Kockovaella imperatae]